MIEFLGAAFVLGGAVVLRLFCGEVWLLFRLRNGVRTLGTVVEHIRHGGYNIPVIQYQCLRGKMISFPAGGQRNEITFSQWERYYGSVPVGTQVQVVYLPKRPENARLLEDIEGVRPELISYPLRLFARKLIRKENRFRRQLRANGIRTVGTVIDHNRPSASEISHFPKIQFQDQRGDVFTFTHKLMVKMGDKTPSIPAVGERVWIIYNPNSPNLARMSESAAKTVANLAATAAVGLCCLGAGLVLLFKGTLVS